MNEVLTPDGVSWPVVVEAPNPQAQLVLADPAAFDVTNMDGWSVAQVKERTGSMILFLGEVERRTKEMRYEAGVGLWKLREALPDGEYGRVVSEMARNGRVGVRTLQRWRVEAEEHYGIPSKSAARIEARRQRPKGIEVTAQEKPSSVEEGVEPLESPSSTDAQEPTHPFQTAPVDPEPETEPAPKPAAKPKSTRSALSVVKNTEAEPEPSSAVRGRALGSGSGSTLEEFLETLGDRIEDVLAHCSLGLLLDAVRKRKEEEWAAVPLGVVVGVREAAAKRERVEWAAKRSERPDQVQTRFKGKS